MTERKPYPTAEDNYKKQEKLAEIALNRAKRKFERRLSQASKVSNNNQFNAYIRSKPSVDQLLAH